LRKIKRDCKSTRIFEKERGIVSSISLTGRRNEGRIFYEEKKKKGCRFRASQDMSWKETRSSGHQRPGV